MRLYLTIKIWKEGKNYIAYCPELEVASQGRNLEHAFKRIKEALEGFLEETKKMGTLEEILEKAGFVRKKNKWQAPIMYIFPLEIKI
jgi:predicted RNase H-like HicB family nuclease